MARLGCVCCCAACCALPHPAFHWQRLALSNGDCVTEFTSSVLVHCTPAKFITTRGRAVVTCDNTCLALSIDAHSLALAMRLHLHPYLRDLHARISALCVVSSSYDQQRRHQEVSLVPIKHYTCMLTSLCLQLCARYFH